MLKAAIEEHQETDHDIMGVILFTARNSTVIQCLSQEVFWNELSERSGTEITVFVPGVLGPPREVQPNASETTLRGWFRRLFLLVIGFFEFRVMPYLTGIETPYEDSLKLLPLFNIDDERLLPLLVLFSRDTEKGGYHYAKQNIDTTSVDTVRNSLAKSLETAADTVRAYTTGDHRDPAARKREAIKHLMDHFVMMKRLKFMAGLVRYLRFTRVPMD